MNVRAKLKRALLEAERAPKDRRSRLAIDARGHPRLSGRIDRPVVWFEANHYAVDGTTGLGVWSDTDYSIMGFVDGVASLLVYVTDGRVGTVTFSMLLRPYQVDLSIEAMRGRGLGRFVGPALREFQRQLRHYKRETPELRTYLRRALHSQSSSPSPKRKSRPRSFRVGTQTRAARRGCSCPPTRGLKS